MIGTAIGFRDLLGAKRWNTISLNPYQYKQRPWYKTIGIDNYYNFTYGIITSKPTFVEL